MSAKLTTQEFIDHSRAVHGDKYGYAFSVYQSARVKVFIYCHVHGMFEQSPHHHVNGRGCPGCYGNKKHDNCSFIQKAREIHGDKYDYSKVEYKNNYSKVTINCPEHGDFEQKVTSHISGHGCAECVGLRKNTNESFIEKSKKVHGYRYSYSKVSYVCSQEKVTITCPEHGDFEQIANAHLRGQGCPGCAEYGFDRTKVGFLYVLRSDCGRYMKIGITHNPKQRHNKLKRDTPFSFERIELIEGPGDQIADLEKELLAEYKPIEFDNQFDGYTEWRSWDNSIRDHLV